MCRPVQCTHSCPQRWTCPACKPFTGYKGPPLLPLSASQNHHSHFEVPGPRGIPQFPPGKFIGGNLLTGTTHWRLLTWRVQLCWRAPQWLGTNLPRPHLDAIRHCPLMIFPIIQQPLPELKNDTRMASSVKVTGTDYN